MIIRTLLIAIAVLTFYGNVYSQATKYTTENKRAASSFQQAIEAYNKYEYGVAEMLLQHAVKQDDNFIEAYLLLSQIYQETRHDEKAVVAGERAIKINPNFYPNIYYNLGNIVFRRGEYERALSFFNKFLSYNNIREETKEVALLRRNSCEFAINSIANPVPFSPINLGSNINSNMDDYWPSLSADENTLVITVNMPIDTTSPEIIYNRQEDFYISTRDSDGEWQPVRSIGPPINSPRNNEGAQSLTADGQRMYYTVCRGNCNIYVSDKEPNGTWGRPRMLPEPLNLSYTSEKQPSISPDGQTLFFVSNRKTGMGEFDIWRSTRIDDHKWSEPENLGDSINTRFNEQSPFIHFDNQTLYFSSNGHVGMGGLDIYVTRIINDSTWSTPVNLGYPINTQRDEDGLIVNARGTMAYFSSDINPESGRDIYKFELPQEVRPTPSSYISGKISDARSGFPLMADFVLVDIDNDQEIMSTRANSEGSFLICIPTNRKYALFASTPGYLFYSDHFNLTGIFSASEPYRKNIELNPIRVGGTIVMRNVFFETAKFELKSESIVELTKLAELLSLNPTMVIEVGGHTDNVGSAEYNLTLSDNRAKSVAQHLISNGVNANRITWKGYGYDKPIGDNTTEQGRAENRRTEIRVVGM